MFNYQDVGHSNFAGPMGNYSAPGANFGMGHANPPPPVNYGGGYGQPMGNYSAFPGQNQYGGPNNNQSNYPMGPNQAVYGRPPWMNQGGQQNLPPWYNQNQYYPKK